MFISAVAASTLAVACGLASMAMAAPLSYAVEGTSGYLSEWQFSGRISAGPEGQGLAGSLAMKHTGVCGRNGPDEKPAEMRVRIVSSKPASRIDGDLLLDGEICTFSGIFTGAFSGSINCPVAKGVPFSFSMR
jgi:hypothetical protein